MVTTYIITIGLAKRKNKRKLLAQQQQIEISKSKLAVVRAQLNPHFMFNAMAGIQSLMNQQKTEEANAYLGKFSRLTRNVLDNEELISLAEEKELLDDYLQMEQLRFGFNYTVNIQPEVDLNTEIPVMLLQPFVENAVKHGIAEKGKDGAISISFAKVDNDLILEIKDNGLGFDTSKNYEGLGLSLSKSRIALLNNIYKENELVLEMKASEKGTIITVVLKQWL
jgi:two-component system LytT family sensor kinase